MLAKARSLRYLHCVADLVWSATIEKQTNFNPMKKSILLSVAGTLACLALASSCATHESQASLESQAKVTKAQAQEIALAKVPGGTVKEAEIEKEHGKVIWSFDIATAGTKDITEVQVDATTGNVVAVEHETPADQEKEKKEKN